MKVYAVKVCLVQKSCAEISVEAETPGDVHAIAEGMLRSGAVMFCASEEDAEVQSVIQTNAEPIETGKVRRR